MNLASRCRDAIGQVAALKKQLAQHQRRAAEALALVQKQKKHIQQQQLQQIQQQREQQRATPTNNNSEAGPDDEGSSNNMTEVLVATPTNSNNKVTGNSNKSEPVSVDDVEPSPSPPMLKIKQSSSSVLSDVAAEIERMDRILAEHAPYLTTATATTTPSSIGSTSSGKSNKNEDETTTTTKATSNSSSPDDVRTSLNSDDEAVTDTSSPSGNTADDEVSAAASPPATSPKVATAASVDSPPGTHLVSSDDFEDDDDDAMLNGSTMMTAIDDSNGTDEDQFEEEAAALIKDVTADFANAEKETKEQEAWDTIGSTTPHRVGELKQRQQQQHLLHHHQPIFPHSASPKLPKSYNEEYPGDISVKPHSHHHHSQSKKGLIGMNHLLKKNENAENNDASILQPHLAPFDSLKTKQDKSTLSSIDAFEASFNVTSFPDSFSPKENTSSTSDNTSPTKEIYNPFQYSPAKPPSPWKDDSMDIEDAAVAAATSTTTAWASSKSGSSGGGRGSARITEPPTFSINGSPSSRSSCSSSVGSASRFSGDPPGRDRTSPRPAIYSKPVDIGNNYGNNNNNSSNSSPQGSAKAKATSSPVMSNAAINAAASAALSLTLSSSSSSSGAPSTLADSSSAASTRKSPIPSDSSNAKLPLPSPPSSSFRQSPRSSPVTTITKSMSSSPTNQQPAPSTPTFSRTAANDAYSTPPQPGSSPTSMSSYSSSVSGRSSNEPKRPEKTSSAGYEAARVRYEKALKPRSNSPPTNEALQPVTSNDGNLKKITKKQSPKETSHELFGDAGILSDEDDGFIPLKSSSVKKKEVRQRPWEMKSSSPELASASKTPSPTSQRKNFAVKDDAIIDPSNSPLSRNRHRIGIGNNNKPVIDDANTSKLSMRNGFAGKE